MVNSHISIYSLGPNRSDSGTVPEESEIVEDKALSSNRQQILYWKIFAF